MAGILQTELSPQLPELALSKLYNAVDCFVVCFRIFTKLYNLSPLISGVPLEVYTSCSWDRIFQWDLGLLRRLGQADWPVSLRDSSVSVSLEWDWRSWTWVLGIKLRSLCVRTARVLPTEPCLPWTSDQGVIHYAQLLFQSLRDQNLKANEMACHQAWVQSRIHKLEEQNQLPKSVLWPPHTQLFA